MIKVEEIDIPRSKKTQRLFLRRSHLDETLSVIFRTLLVSTLPLITIIYSFNHADSFYNDKFGYIMGIVVSLIVAYLIYNYFNNSNEIRRIKGKDMLHNKVFIENIAKKLNWEIYDNKNDVIILRPGWHRQIVIIFDFNELLINTIHFGRQETATFGQIHGTFDNLNYEVIYQELKPYFNLPVLDLNK